MHRFLVGLCLLLPLVAGAAEISVLPVGLSLSVQQDRRAITVTNHGAEALVMQAEAVAWSQANGVDNYVSTRDLAINPLIFSIPPGGAQVVRVGLRRAPAPGREIAYRLFLREVPPPSEPQAVAAGGQQVRVLMELRLPVYVAPADPKPARQWRAWRRPDGGLALEVANTGNVHLVVAGLKLRLPGEPDETAPFASLEANATVLAGERRTWEISRLPAKALGDAVDLEVTSDHGSQHVELDLGGH